MPFAILFIWRFARGSQRPLANSTAHLPNRCGPTSMFDPCLLPRHAAVLGPWNGDCTTKRRRSRDFRIAPWRRPRHRWPVPQPASYAFDPPPAAPDAPFRAPGPSPMPTTRRRLRDRHAFESSSPNRWWCGRRPHRRRPCLAASRSPWALEIGRNSPQLFVPSVRSTGAIPVAVLPTWERRRIRIVRTLLYRVARSHLRGRLQASDCTAPRAPPQRSPSKLYALQHPYLLKLRGPLTWRLPATKNRSGSAAALLIPMRTLCPTGPMS